MDVIRAISSIIEFMKYEFLKKIVIECETTCVYFQIIFSRIFSK